MNSIIKIEGIINQLENRKFSNSQDIIRKIKNIIFFIPILYIKTKNKNETANRDRKGIIEVKTTRLEV